MLNKIVRGYLDSQKSNGRVIWLKIIQAIIYKSQITVYCCGRKEEGWQSNKLAPGEQRWRAVRHHKEG